MIKHKAHEVKCPAAVDAFLQCVRPQQLPFDVLEDFKRTTRERDDTTLQHLPDAHGPARQNGLDHLVEVNVRAWLARNKRTIHILPRPAGPKKP